MVGASPLVYFAAASPSSGLRSSPPLPGRESYPDDRPLTYPAPCTPPPAAVWRRRRQGAPWPQWERPCRPGPSSPVAGPRLWSRRASHCGATGWRSGCRETTMTNIQSRARAARRVRRDPATVSRYSANSHRQTTGTCGYARFDFPPLPPLLAQPRILPTVQESRAPRLRPATVGASAGRHDRLSRLAAASVCPSFPPFSSASPPSSRNPLHSNAFEFLRCRLRSSFCRCTRFPAAGARDDNCEEQGRQY